MSSVQNANAGPIFKKCIKDIKVVIEEQETRTGLCTLMSQVCGVGPELQCGRSQGLGKWKSLGKNVSAIHMWGLLRFMTKEGAVVPVGDWISAVMTLPTLMQTHLQQCPLGRARSAVGWRAQLSPVQRHFPGQWASPSPNFLKYKMVIMILAFQDRCEVMHVKRLKLHSCIFIPEHRLWSPKASSLNPEPDLAHVSSWASDFTPTSQLPHL